MTLASAQARATANPPRPANDVDGFTSVHLVIENLHCPACIRKIESGLNAEPDVLGARVNLTTKRLGVQFRAGKLTAEKIITILDRLGYRATTLRPELMAEGRKAGDRELLKAMGVAGFAAANVMLLSVSIWAGDDMNGVTRDFMHWISALIALPAIGYAGQPFFRSALGALRGRHLNMDVPISLAVLLSALMSVVETLRHAEQAYFDASVMLLFFLLIGRYLDRMVRTRARSVAENLLALRVLAATVVADDGSKSQLPVEALRPGMTVAILAGDRIPVDGIVMSGLSSVDASLVTGESIPVDIAKGAQVFAGTLNLAGELRVTVSAVDEDTLLAEIVRLMEAAEQGRARYVRLADRAARIYAPTVHILAALTFAGSMLLGHLGWEASLMNAIAVLIITCPCALGLAVPAVQVVASSQLLKRGILLKSADGLEKLAAIDYVVFDKTGTLTLGMPELLNGDEIPVSSLQLAAKIAASSRHPLARALVRAAGPGEGGQAAGFETVREEGGMGLEAETAAGRYRLGNRSWCGVDESLEKGAAVSELWLTGPGLTPQRFAFADRLRADSTAVIKRFHENGIEVELLSGDRPALAEQVARELGINRFSGGVKPDGKIARLNELVREGRKVLMVGDGLNDAPALAAAHASMSPATASDVSQTVADLVFQGERLMPVIDAWQVAKKANRLILQNFALSIGYNVIAVPLAALGMVTPLIAALAMSSSSIIVTLNALRLRVRDGMTGRAPS
jgi:Cu2+-exporting ATPase